MATRKSTRPESGEEVYAAHLYPPDAIPELAQALALMRQAHQLLDQLLEDGMIQEGDPAEDACNRLWDAIGMMESDENDESDSDQVSESVNLHLVIDNTRPGAGNVIPIR